MPSIQGLKVVFGCDHAGWAIKNALLDFLKKEGAQIEDLGCQSAEDRTDYPDFAGEVGRRVAQKKSDLGLLCCGTGIGMSIAANKIKGIRAAVVWNSETAALAREHNQANVLCLGGRHFKPEEAVAALKSFLEASPSTEGRHQTRIKKIGELEEKFC